MPLDIITEVRKLQTMYKEDPRQSSYNILVTGESGSGKTHLASTARKPVLVDSFDPGGSKCLKPWIDKGEIVVDSRWENEDPFHPKAFKEWKREMEWREKEGFLSHFATYMLDSATTWSIAIMDYILDKAGIAGDAPRFTKDYQPQKVEIQNYIYRLLRSPCDFILTAHLERHDDKVGDNVIQKFRFMTTGKGAITIPLLFDELYVMAPREISSGIEYRILTQATGTYVARSRLAEIGKFSPYEKADIKHLLTKAGLPTTDKPLFGEKGGKAS